MAETVICIFILRSYRGPVSKNLLTLILFIDKLVFKICIVSCSFVCVHTLTFAFSVGLFGFTAMFSSTKALQPWPPQSHRGYNSFQPLFPGSFSAVTLRAVLLRPGRFDFLEGFLGTVSHELQQSLCLINKDAIQIPTREWVSGHSWRTGQHHTTVCPPVISPSQWLVNFLPGVMPNGVTRLTVRQPSDALPSSLLSLWYYGRQLLKANLKFSWSRCNCLSLHIIYQSGNLKMIDTRSHVCGCICNWYIKIQEELAGGHVA